MATQPNVFVSKLSLTELLIMPSETGWAFIVEACSMTQIASFIDAMAYVKFILEMGGMEDANL